MSKHKRMCKKTQHDDLNAFDNCHSQVIHNNTTNNNNNITNNNNNNTYNDHSTTINNIQVNVRAFGFENKDYITEEKARECFFMGSFGVNQMLEDIFFNTEHPENHNVFLRSLKNSLVYVMNPSGKMECRSLFDVIDKMIHASAREIMNKGGGELCITQPSDEHILLAQSIQNIPSDKHKMFRDKTKSRLVQRRDECITKNADAITD